MGKKLSLQGTDGREESLSVNKARLSGHLQGSYLSIHPSIHPSYCQPPTMSQEALRTLERSVVHSLGF